VSFPGMVKDDLGEGGDAHAQAQFLGRAYARIRYLGI
jgi:hypothetical protein